MQIQTLVCCISHSLSHIPCTCLHTNARELPILGHSSPGTGLPPSFLPLPLLWLFVMPKHLLDSESKHLLALYDNQYVKADRSSPVLLFALASCGQALPTSPCPQPPFPLSLPDSECLCLFTCLLIHFHFSTFFLSFCAGRLGHGVDHLIAGAPQ